MLANLRARWVDGALEFFTRGTNKRAMKLSENGIQAALNGVYTKSTAANFTLDDEDKCYVAFILTATAGSKTVTLELPAGQVAIVVNGGGTNAFTLKNVTGDTGTSIATGKAVLVIASATADESTVIAIN